MHDEECHLTFSLVYAHLNLTIGYSLGYQGEVIMNNMLAMG